MEAIAELAKSIGDRKIERATEASIEQNLLDGPRLFHLSCHAIKAGLRIDHPEADDDTIHQLLIERVYKRR